MARASSCRAKHDGMRRRSKDAKPKHLAPKKKGSREKDKLNEMIIRRSRQSHKKRN